jgi:hypothetical protein
MLDVTSAGTILLASEVERVSACAANATAPALAASSSYLWTHAFLI